jgi:hypothetical protein
MIEVIAQGTDVPELNTEIVFRRRPLSLPEDLRPAWRIGLLVLLLSTCCRSGKSSRARLHVLSWGIRTKESQVDLVAAISGNLNPGTLLVRFDPFLDRALDFAIGEGAIQHIGGKSVALTQTGKRLSEEIRQSDSVFVAEKKFIDLIDQKVSEELVRQMFGWKD